MILHLKNDIQVLIDDDDAEHVLRYTWWWDGKYVYTQINRRTLRLHRLILNAPADKHVDHISGDRLDNRKANLRLATPRQNIMNQGRRRDNTSGYKGVSFDKRSGRWYAYINADGRMRNLGLHSTAEEAAAVYNQAAIAYFGEYARLNDVALCEPCHRRIHPHMQGN